MILALKFNFLSKPEAIFQCILEFCVQNHLDLGGSWSSLPEIPMKSSRQSRAKKEGVTGLHEPGRPTGSECPPPHLFFSRPFFIYLFSMVFTNSETIELLTEGGHKPGQIRKVAFSPNQMTLGGFKPSYKSKILGGSHSLHISSIGRLFGVFDFDP